MSKDQLICPSCHGTGIEDEDGNVLCSNCAATISYRDDGSLNDIHVQGNNHKEIKSVASSLLQPKSTQTKPKDNSAKSLDEIFRNHPVVWGLTLLAIGAGSGFGFNVAMSKPDNKSEPRLIECKLEGLDQLTEKHHLRISSLQNKLMELEAKSSDHSLISSDQDKYIESAVRVRSDIQHENNAYDLSLNQIMSKCQ